jgi:hypothetical protein
VRAAADLLGTVGVTVRAISQVAGTNALVIGFLRLAVAGPTLAAIHHATTGPRAFCVARRDLPVVGIMGGGAAAVHVTQCAAFLLIGVARTAQRDRYRPALHHPHRRPGVAGITAHAHDQTGGRDDRMLRTFIADALSGLIGLGIIVVGARFLLAPRAAAAGYGVIVPPEAGRVGAYLGAKGVRDIAAGLFVFILLAFRATHILGAIMVAASIIPIGDAVIVRAHGGSRATAFGVHDATAALLLVTAAFLLAAPA